MDEQKYKLFCAARRIADIVFELIASDSELDEDLFLDDTRSEGLFNSSNQTEEGLYLELYYGLPSRLRTPWGTWKFGGSGGGGMRKILETLLSRFEAAIYLPKTSDSNGDYGQVYALHKVDGEPLPEPKARERSAYMTHEEADREWKKMEKRFRSEKKEC